MAELKMDFGKMMEGFIKTAKKNGMFVGWWIPVSERLPKEDEYDGNVCKYYLIQDEYGDMHVAHYKKIGWIPMRQIKALEDNVIAWMPLPPCYEPQESDHKCHTCKYYTSGELDGSCGSYICKHYSNWESEVQE